jgi:hypothetical protein
MHAFQQIRVQWVSLLRSISATLPVWPLIRSGPPAFAPHLLRLCRLEKSVSRRFGEYLQETLQGVAGLIE